MSNRRVRITFQQRDPADSPENVEFAWFCLQQGIDILDSRPIPLNVDIHTDDAEAEETESRTIKDEALETDVRRDAQATLEAENQALDQADAEQETEDGSSPLPEPKVVVSRMKDATLWVGSFIAAGWSITVKAAVTAALEHYDKKG